MSSVVNMEEGLGSLCLMARTRARLAPSGLPTAAEKLMLPTAWLRKADE